MTCELTSCSWLNHRSPVEIERSIEGPCLDVPKDAPSVEAVMGFSSCAIWSKVDLIVSEFFFLV